MIFMTPEITKAFSWHPGGLEHKYDNQSLDCEALQRVDGR